MNQFLKRQRGFTLIEVLLAVTILGIILTTVYGALSRTLSSKDIAEEHAELFASGRDAVLKMANDIEAALPPPAGDRIYFRGVGSSGQAPSLELVTMNRGGYGLNQVRPGEVLVVYTLDAVARLRDVYALRREEHLFAALLAEADGIQSPMENADDSAPTAIATYLLDCPSMPDDLKLPGSCMRVATLRFRYFDEATKYWSDEWDTTQDSMLGRLPSAVEVALVLKDEDGTEYDFSTIVDLPLSRGQPTPEPGEEDIDDDLDDDGGALEPQPAADPRGRTLLDTLFPGINRQQQKPRNLRDLLGFGR